MKKLYYVTTRDTTSGDGYVIYAGYDRGQAAAALENELEEIRDTCYHKYPYAADCDVFNVPDDAPEWDEMDDEEQQYILDNCEDCDARFEINEVWRVVDTYARDEDDDEIYGEVHCVFGSGYTASDLYRDSNNDISMQDEERIAGDVVAESFTYVDKNGILHTVSARIVGYSIWPAGTVWDY